MTEEKPQVKVDKPDWQVTIWKYFLDVKDIVVVKIKLGTALILLYCRHILLRLVSGESRENK
jgi:hypothetical protein